MEIVKHILDGVSFGSVSAAFVGLLTLPNLVYLATLIWWILRIYEMKTVQKFLDKYRKKKPVP